MIFLQERQCNYCVDVQKMDDMIDQYVYILKRGRRFYRTGYGVFF